MKGQVKISAVLDSMFGVAKAIAPLGGPAAVAVVEMIDHAVETFGPDAEPDEKQQLVELVEQRDVIEKAVNQHVDRTVADLRGEG